MIALAVLPILIMALMFLNFGPLSVPALIFLMGYIPAASIFYKLIAGADYVNYMNYWLQQDAQTVGYGLGLLSLSMGTTFACLVWWRRAMPRSNAGTFVLNSTPSATLFYGLLVAALFFLWLAAPGRTILTASYSDVLGDRIQGTEYARSVGIICWLICFQVFLCERPREPGLTFGTRGKVFVAATVGIALWLFLHSNRMPLSAILLAVVVSMVARRATRQAAILLGVSVLLLTVLGGVRELLYDPELLKANTSPPVAVAALPGGASNAFMSFIIVCHYFTGRPFLMGETFYNYVLQLLPGPLYRVADIAPPPYFDSIGLFDGYDWNGGIYAPSVFYANFGLVGMVLFGIFVAVYIIAVSRLLVSGQIMLKVLGYYMVGYAMAIFWYEPIQLLKPLWFILLIHLLFMASRRRLDPRNAARAGLTQDAAQWQAP